MEVAVDATPTFVCVCHCESCRRSAGAPMVAWATFPAGAFHVVRGALLEFESSPGVRRGHCARCGTSLSYRNERRAGEVDLTLACLREAFVPTAHIWVQDKLQWIVLDDGLPQYPQVVTS